MRLSGLGLGLGLELGLGLGSLEARSHTSSPSSDCQEKHIRIDEIGLSEVWFGFVQLIKLSTLGTFLFKDSYLYCSNKFQTHNSQLVSVI